VRVARIDGQFGITGVSRAIDYLTLLCPLRLLGKVTSLLWQLVKAAPGGGVVRLEF